MNNTTNTADHRSLYEVTGDIKDINTMLVPRSTLATPTQAAALVSPTDAQIDAIAVPAQTGWCEGCSPDNCGGCATTS